MPVHPDRADYFALVMPDGFSHPYALSGSGRSIYSPQLLAEPSCVLDVVNRAVLHLGDLLRTQLAHDLRGCADDQRAIGKALALCHYAACADDAVATDPRPVEHY